MPDRRKTPSCTSASITPSGRRTIRVMASSEVVTGSGAPLISTWRTAARAIRLHWRRKVGE